MDTTAGTDPPAPNPQGRARRRRTPDSPGPALRREGRTRPPCRTPATGHSHVTGHEEERPPQAVTARPRRRRAVPGRAREPGRRGGLGRGLQAYPRSRGGNAPKQTKGGDGEPRRDPPPKALAKGRRPCTPRPGQGRPPPPLFPERAAAPGAERHWVHAPRTPGPSPARSNSDLGKPRRQTACHPARRPPAGTQEGPPDCARTGARGREPEQYGDHTLHGLSDADEACLGARSGEAEGRNEAEQPPAPRPPGPTDRPGSNHAPNGGGKRTTPAPPTPQAPDRPGRTGPPTRGRATQSQARRPRDRATPQRAK